MSVAKRISRLCSLLALLVLAAGLTFALTSLNAPTRVLSVPEEAAQKTEELMAAIAQGDHAQVSAMLLGQPQLGETNPEDAMEQLLWKAYHESIQYEFSGDLQADGQGLTRDVTVTFLDISGVLKVLQEEISDVLAAAVAQASDPELVYDEESGYREDFVAPILTAELRRILENQTITASKTISVRLVTREGQWWVVPDSALLDILAGGMGK